jgi:hypothetical protein
MMLEADPGAACEGFRLCAGEPCVGPVPPPGGRSPDVERLHPAWQCAPNKPSSRWPTAARAQLEASNHRQRQRGSCVESEEDYLDRY